MAVEIIVNKFLSNSKRAGQQVSAGQIFGDYVYKVRAPFDPSTFPLIPASVRTRTFGSVQFDSVRFKCLSITSARILSIRMNPVYHSCRHNTSFVTVR